jgi:hypothetical protein
MAPVHIREESNMWNRVKNLFTGPRAAHERLSDSPSEAEPIDEVMASSRRDAQATTTDAITNEEAKAKKAKAIKADLEAKGFL